MAGSFADAFAAQKHNLFPHPRVGQTYRYLIEAHSEKRIRTDSRVVHSRWPAEYPQRIPLDPARGHLDIQPRQDRFLIRARSSLRVQMPPYRHSRPKKRQT